MSNLKHIPKRRNLAPSRHQVCGILVPEPGRILRASGMGHGRPVEEKIRLKEQWLDGESVNERALG
jgi:hypothetical protein